MPKKRRTVDMSTPWQPPANSRSRPNTETGQHPWGPGIQQIQMVHPIRNAHGGPRGLSPTETPQRMKGNSNEK